MEKKCERYGALKEDNCEFYGALLEGNCKSYGCLLEWILNVMVHFWNRTGWKRTVEVRGEFWNTTVNI
jgi:hypothetical protein